jgi:hypothetical protein
MRNPQITAELPSKHATINPHGKSKGKRLFEKYRLRRERSVRNDLETGCENVAWFHLARDIVVGPIGRFLFTRH